MTRLLILPVAGLLWATASPAPLPQDVRRLDRLEVAELGAPYPPGWERRTVRGAEAPDSRIADDEQWGRVFRVDAQGAAAFYVRELDRPLDAAAGRLSWTWRVEASPSGAIPGVSGLDDSPARLFVLFGKGGLFSRPKAIFYTWAGGEPTDSAWIQESDHNAAVIVLRRGRDPLATWHEEERDLAADFARMFGPEPAEPVTAVGLLVDTDDTGGIARSLLGPVTWHTLDPLMPREGGGVEE